ncbi:MAG: AAA family ATPase [Planctomycetes bacterium]|nr:AAA family ATPase [Planctomycetota bacterium]
MDLIKRVEVNGFRSIRSADLGTLGPMTSLVGRNSSGKSNILRALNLFFNDEVDPGKPLEFGRDAYNEIPRSRTKKRISVAVTFDLPIQFVFRSGLEALEQFGRHFTITKTWELDPLRKPVQDTQVDREGELIQSGAHLSTQFLSLVRFRYIPNRTVPSRLLKEEGQVVADAILKRVASSQHARGFVASLSKAAERMLRDATSSLVSCGAPLNELSMVSGDSIGQLLRMGGFQARGQHGGLVEDEAWGSGHQSFFLYELLRAIDTSYSRYYGWRQATVWGLEEPEAALHRDLETRLAGEIRRWCLDSQNRLQVLATTHSPVITMGSTDGYWVELTDKSTRVERMSIPKLTKAADKKGVSGWVHPVLSFPWNPVVLVEGPIDERVLSHVADLAGLSDLRFLSLPSLDEAQRGGGKDRIIKYLRENAAILQNRPPTAPLLVLLDWEVSDLDLAKAREAYGPGADRRVIRMDAGFCHSQMGRSFHGIERFYPPRIAVEAHEASEIDIAMRAGRPYSVSKDELERGKRALLGRLLCVVPHPVPWTVS